MRCAVPTLAIVVISLLFAPITSAQGIDSDVESALVSGPTYITLVCDQGSCSGYTLEVISDVNSTFEDSKLILAVKSRTEDVYTSTFHLTNREKE